MRILRLLPVAALLVAASSCSTIKKGSQATWDAVSGAGAVVARGTSKTARTAGNLVQGKIREEPTVAEINLAYEGKRGTVVIALDEKAAPQHADNFRKLVKDGYYNKLLVHRAVGDHLIQAGDPRTRNKDARAVWGLGGPGHTVPAEIGLRHVRGSVGMARLGNRLNPTRQSNGSQFYICLRKLSELDGEYTVFAHVVGGIDVADAISYLPTDENDVPESPAVVESIRMVSGAAPVVKAPPPAAKPAPVIPSETAELAPAGKVPPPPPAAPPARKKGWFGRTLDRIW